MYKKKFDRTGTLNESEITISLNGSLLFQVDLPYLRTEHNDKIIIAFSDNKARTGKNLNANFSRSKTTSRC